MPVDKHILIGTAGHVDHGKTTLISALTGINAERIDRLAEEKKRGITIDLGYAYLTLPNGKTASIIDVPGHEKFIKNMLAGAGGIDLVLLVIAADDGVMPQTREHLGILQLLNAKDGIIVLTKCDHPTAEREWLDMVREDIRALTAPTFLADAPVAEVSALTGLGMDGLRALIFDKIDAAQNHAAPLMQSAFRIPADRVFTMDGFGTVVTGTVTEGMLRVGDTVEIYPHRRSAKVRGIQVHGGDTQAACAGQRAAVNLTGLRREDIKRGDILATPDSIHPTRMLDVRLTALPALPDSKSGTRKEPRAIRTGSRLHFHYGTANALCKVVLLGRDVLKPGEECFGQLRFTESVAVKEGDRFVVRFYSPMETLGGGEVLHISPKKHRAGRTQATVSSLETRARTYATGENTARILQAIADESPRFTSLADIKKRGGFDNAPHIPADISSDFSSAGDTFEAAVAALAADGKIIRITPTHALCAEFCSTFASRLEKALAAFHAENPLQPGIPKEELRSRLAPNVKPALFDALLHIYEGTHDAEGFVLRIVQNYISQYNFAITYTPAQASVRDDILARLAANPFSPPAPDELAAPYKKRSTEFTAVFNAMLTGGELTATEPGVVFLTESIGTAKGIFTALCASSGAVTLSQFRDALATSRKFALSVLEYFDRTGFTRKEGDARAVRV
jgi:selenocysteine-specific elongation factor